MTSTAGTTATTGTTGNTQRKGSTAGTTELLRHDWTTGATESTTESSTATAQSTVTSTAGTQLPLKLLAPRAQLSLRLQEQRKVAQSHPQLHLNQR